MVRNYPPESIPILTQNNLLDEIRARVLKILDNVEILLNNGGDLQICGALYTHAIEEYGKFILIKNSVVSNGICTIDMTSFKDHDSKIKLAQQNLPSDCFTLKQGSFGKHNFGRSNFSVHEVADWEARLSIFNADLVNG